jgi:hypothetical protein
MRLARAPSEMPQSGADDLHHRVLLERVGKPTLLAHLASFPDSKIAKQDAYKSTGRSSLSVAAKLPAAGRAVFVLEQSQGRFLAQV